MVPVDCGGQTLGLTTTVKTSLANYTTTTQKYTYDHQKPPPSRYCRSSLFHCIQRVCSRVQVHKRVVALRDLARLYSATCLVAPCSCDRHKRALINHRSTLGLVNLSSRTHSRRITCHWAWWKSSRPGNTIRLDHSSSKTSV